MMEVEKFYVTIGLVWAANLILGGYVAGQKGRPFGEAFAIGLVFGPFGVLILALLPTLKAAGREAEAGSRSAPNRSTRDLAESDWIDLVDWSDVATEEDERHAKRAALAKYLKLFGPTMREVVLVDGNISWTCQCGRRPSATLDKAGTPVACPECGLQYLVPVPSSKSRP